MTGIIGSHVQNASELSESRRWPRRSLKLNLQTRKYQKNLDYRQFKYWQPRTALLRQLISRKEKAQFETRGVFCIGAMDCIVLDA